MSKSFKSLTAYKKEMNQILIDFQEELGRVMMARNALDIPSKGQQKGYYLKIFH